MKEMSIKNRIIAVVAFLFSAAVIIVEKDFTFAAVYFLCVSPVVFLADKIFDKKIGEYAPFYAYGLFAVAFQPLYHIFFSHYDNTKQLMGAGAVAIFLACICALTDDAKIQYTVVAAPILCFLNVKIAFCFSLLLFVYSVSKFVIEITPEITSENKKQKKNSKKKKNKNTKKKAEENSNNPKTLFILSALTGIICFAVCVYFALREERLFTENFKHLLVNYKNIPGLIILEIYLLFKIFRSNLHLIIKIFVPIGIILHFISGFMLLKIYGFSISTLFIFSSAVYTCLICLNKEEIVQSFKGDFSNHKYLFWALLLLIIR